MGTKKFWNGEMYIGQWKNGKEDGYGLRLSGEKKILFNGKWQEGILVQDNKKLLPKNLIKEKK
ncbi:hypothetical protein LPTSP3_g07630 [Leptospira kobayashii]|uniref:MORN repeat protein n=1 Tax=Leptospira kobayashii TaxID=1917830 RepID=A0ABN6KA31_9LEPT|nr:hypothetical protein LPTSP3_g07630 [Leptospira kobayashii]